jgi:proton-translocating NADH-quinone oxidoreductase chain N
MTHALDYIFVAPMLMLPAFGLIVLILGTIADRFPKGRLNHFAPPEYLSMELLAPTIVMAGATLWASITLKGRSPIDFVPYLSNMITVDPFAAFFGLLAVIGTFIVVVMSFEYFGDHNTKHRAEYFALLFFATTAIVLVAAAKDLLMIYLSLEFLSLSSYVLASYWKNDPKSSEAGIKYFLFGAISSAIMLYGISMLYGLAGTTNLNSIATKLSTGYVVSTPGALAAVIMVLAGLGFKLALVPFHLWAPDTYEGAPTPITAWLSVASKAGGLAVFTRFLLVSFPLTAHPVDKVDWYPVVLLLAIASMTLGNLVAITQKNVKRMLAYSSIAQVGYMLVGILAAAAASTVPGAKMPAIISGSSQPAVNYGLAGLLIYAASYLFMNLGAFAVVIALERKVGRSEIQSFIGLMKRAPFLAVSLVIFFLSLAGIPPTAGFLGKFYIFAGAIQTGRTDLLILALVAVANSVISVYYYFNVVRLMFMHDHDEAEMTEEKLTITASASLKAAILIMVILTIGICLAAGPIIDLARSAAAL